MHGWHVAFTPSSKTLSEDDSVIFDGGSRYLLEPGFFCARQNRNLARPGKSPLATGNDDGETCRPSGRFERSMARSVSALPQPLPELQLLMRRDPKFASSSSCSVPLPSPESVGRRRGGSVDTDRERDEERRRTDALIADAIDGLNELKRLLGQHTWTNVEHCETQSARKTTQKGNAKRRSSSSCSINCPTSAPSSPYSSSAVSPTNGDMFAIHYMTPPSVFHVWSAPEMPHSDGNLGLSSYYQMSYEKTATSLENSPLQSPRLSFRLHGTSPPKSPLPAKISSETPAARWECNAPASVHPLPRPPGVGTPSQTTSTPQVSSTSDLSAASMPSPATPITTLSAKPDFPGANISAQPSVVSQVAGKPELIPIKYQWVKGKLIGRGTFGSVYVASNRETGALCAMKEVEILPNDSKSAESMKQLEQEIKVLSHLKHPNIVQYYGCEIIGGKFYIYLEYVHPGSINNFFQDHCGVVTESIVRNFTRHILCGLAYLHSKKTIHRDIKGANLLVDAYGVVKLADFGMSKHLLQFEMQKDTSIDLALAVDIWSLGCTIIEMMNGKPPWSEYEGAAALFKVLKETPPIPETLSADGLRLMDNMQYPREWPCHKFDQAPAVQGTDQEGETGEQTQLMCDTSARQQCHHKAHCLKALLLLSLPSLELHPARYSSKFYRTGELEPAVFVLVKDALRKASVLELFLD
ncbi:Mitogen-activated protein kinase kinase kinase [Sesamum alatum]|uniref:mitogen-activated protein kinase kinase kinase n=1 Tax=Sesamum alatum TaxID=300844 RepID=A0AAE2CL97_9LAMI|nr:Mitogen-activated protein kinase kinase kinase [Sesamum alatum]